MSCDIHAALQTFADLGQYDAIDVVADQFATLQLSSKASRIAVLKRGDQLAIRSTRFNTFFVQINSCAPIPLLTGAVTLTAANTDYLLDRESELYHTGSSIIQKCTVKKEIAEQIFGSSSLRDDATIERTLFHLKFNTPVTVEATLHPCYNNITSIAQTVDSLIREHFKELTKDDLPGLRAAERYFSFTHNAITDTLKTSIMYAEQNLQDESNFALWLFKFGDKVEDAGSRLVQFLNNAGSKEQKQFWRHAAAQSTELLSLLKKHGSEIRQLYFPRLEPMTQFFEPAPEDFIFDAIACCPSLQKVSFYPLDTAKNPLTNCTKLLEVNFEEDPVVSDWLPPAPHLKNLTLKVAPASFSSFSLKSLPGKYPKLESLTVSGRDTRKFLSEVDKLPSKVKVKIV